jgi:hypothetical protein
MCRKYHEKLNIVADGWHLIFTNWRHHTRQHINPQKNAQAYRLIVNQRVWFNFSALSLRLLKIPSDRPPTCNDLFFLLKSPPNPVPPRRLSPSPKPRTSRLPRSFRPGPKSPPFHRPMSDHLICAPSCRSSPRQRLARRRIPLGVASCMYHRRQVQPASTTVVGYGLHQRNLPLLRSWSKVMLCSTSKSKLNFSYNLQS